MAKGDQNDVCFTKDCERDMAICMHQPTKKYYCVGCAMIMKNMVRGKWNGDTNILFCAVDYVVQQPSNPMWWSAHHVGETRQGILVLNPEDGYRFLIDNKFGDGWYKVAVGNGSPGCGHKSADVAWVSNIDVDVVAWVRVPDWEGIKAENQMHEEAIKKSDPIAYERLMAIRSAMSKSK
jgi:hypothetical protein